jgi:hypothetical protein
MPPLNIIKSDAFKAMPNRLASRPVLTPKYHPASATGRAIREAAAEPSVLTRKGKITM